MADNEVLRDFYELRHAWNRFVYHATKGLPRDLQRALRRKLFGTTGLTESLDAQGKDTP